MFVVNRFAAELPAIICWICCLKIKSLYWCWVSLEQLLRAWCLNQRSGRCTSLSLLIEREDSSKFSTRCNTFFLPVERHAFANDMIGALSPGKSNLGTRGWIWWCEDTMACPSCRTKWTKAVYLTSKGIILPLYHLPMGWTKEKTKQEMLAIEAASTNEKKGGGYGLEEWFK